MKNKTTLFIIGAALLGLILLVFGSFGGKTERGTMNETDEIEAYCSYLEEQAVRLCESVRGVSDVTVTLTLEGGFEQVYAADRKVSGGTQSLEYVKLGSGSSAELCAVSGASPKVAGIGVTCKGGRDEALRKELTALLSAAFGVGSNKIYITE